jgi:hypothetical protein
MLAPVIAALAMVVAAAADVPVAFRTIAQGTDSKIEVRRELVARTAGSWQLVWFKHHGTHTPPPIDPRQEMIVAVFGGSQATGAQAVNVVSVTREGRTLVVRYRMQSETTASRDAAIQTTPFHIIAVPQDGAAVRFLEVRDVYPVHRPDGPPLAVRLEKKMRTDDNREARRED